MAVRLKTIGKKIYLPDGVTEYIPRGYCQDAVWNVGDGALLVANGANFTRLELTYYSALFPSSGALGQYDAYDPTAPNNLNVKIFTNWQNQIADNLSVGSNTFWVSIGMRGCNGDFFDNPTAQAQWIASWVAIANIYKNVNYIACYEIIAEPQTNDDAGQNCAKVLAVIQNCIDAIRTVDPYTPIAIGPPKNYDIRNLSLFVTNTQNIWYFFNFYELLFYVKQAKTTNQFIGYPNYFLDNKGKTPGVGGSYPGKGQTVLMDKTFLTGLAKVASDFSTSNNVPVFCDQIGIRTVTPGSYQYIQDVCDIMISFGIGWAIWTIRSYYSASGLLAGDIGMYWQDKQGKLFAKNSVDNSIANGGDGFNWLGMMATKFAGTLSSAPAVPPCGMQRNINTKSFDFNVVNNCDYSKEWKLVDKNGNSLIANNCILILSIKSMQDLGADPILVLSDVPNLTSSGIILSNDFITSGKFTVTMLKADIENLISSGSQFENYYYNLKMINQGIYEETYLQGVLSVFMGVST